jgi:hypothetical protein
MVTFAAIIIIVLTAPLWIPIALAVGVLAFVICCFLGIVLLFIYLVTNAAEAAPLAVDVISQLPIKKGSTLTRFLSLVRCFTLFLNTVLIRIRYSLL